MELQTRFNFTKIDHSKSNKIHLVATIQAPAIDWVAQRPKICVLPVIDRSGSMRGAKLDYAKTSVIKLIEQLALGDFAGLMTFDSTVQVLVEPAEVTAEHKTKLLNAAGRIQTAGSTNFSDALSEAIRQTENLDLPASFTTRVIFFTDGQPTHGIVDKASLQQLVQTTRGRTSISFFGYGDQGSYGCDQELLSNLATTAEGNYAYVQNPDDALTAFGRELGGLLSTYGSDLRLIIEPRGGHSIKVISDVKSEEADDGEVTLLLGDILSEEVRHVVLEVDTREQDKAFPRETTLLSAKATCMRVTQSGSKEGLTVESSGRVQFVRPNEAQAEADRTLDEIVATHQLVRAQIEAEELAKKGDYATAQGILRSIGANFEGRKLNHVATLACNGVNMVANQSVYGASAGYRTSMRRGITRSASLTSADAGALTDLAGVSFGIGLGNSTQQAFAEQFASDSSPVADPSPWQPTPTRRR